MTTPQPPAKSEDELRDQIIGAFDHYYRDGYEGDWYISNGDSFHGTIDNLMRLVRLYVAQEAEEHADRVIGSDKTLPRYITEWSEEDGEEYWYNKLRAEQRSRNHYPLEGGE